MSPRELRLRERIDSLMDRIAVLEAVVAEQESVIESHYKGKRPCSNCGADCRGEMCHKCRAFFRAYKKPCDDCGQICGGDRCRECLKARRGRRRECADCGKGCRGMRCRECYMAAKLCREVAA